MKRIKTVVIGFLLAIFWACQPKPAENIRISNVFGNNMVLQRDAQLMVWGKANPKGKVYVELAGNSTSAIVTKDSVWEAMLPPIKAGGPYELTISGNDTTIVFNNILIGDVFMASGQSNMVWKMGWGVTGGEEEVKHANYSNIRFFTTGTDYSKESLFNVKEGEWKLCTPENVNDFSAVAYYFAKQIHEERDVPVGVIVSAIGGTTIKGWIPDVQNKFGNAPELNDTSMIYPDYDDNDWHTAILPNFLEDVSPQYRDYDGYSWFRKTFRLDKNELNGALEIHLGKIDDADKTWFNGQLIGETDSYNALRVYQVNEELVLNGENTLVVRVLDGSGKGGFWDNPDDMYIADADGKILNLSGAWKFNNTILPQFPSDRLVAAQPGVMFNAMVYPFTRFPVRAFLWYQGEADVSVADLYDDKMVALINSWRKHWENDSLPFLYVQIPNYLSKVDEVVQSDSKWALLRESQKNVLDIPRTAMVTTIDIGEANDIHPKNKEDVGKRLALAANKIVYAEDIVFSGPMYNSHHLKGDTLVVEFTHKGSGLLAKGGELNGFALVGKEGRYIKPKAWIENNQVFLHSPKVDKPIAIRYGWADNPNCNLYNIEGLPASPFRTDTMKNK